MSLTLSQLTGEINKVPQRTTQLVLSSSVPLLDVLWPCVRYEVFLPRACRVGMPRDVQRTLMAIYSVL